MQRRFALVAVLTLALISSGPQHLAQPVRAAVPTSCGLIGAAAWPGTLPAVPLATRPALRAGVVTVTNSSDIVNGDTSSPAALRANPGPDGISLREAILSINSLPADYTVSFAPALLGATIQLGSELPAITAPHVTIDGDIQGSGTPGVTIRGAPSFAVIVQATDVSLYAFTLTGFTIGVLIGTKGSHQTITNEYVANLSISANSGIVLQANPGAFTAAQSAYNTWTQIRFIGNSMTVTASGIALYDDETIGDDISGVTIARNTIHGGLGGVLSGGGDAINVDNGYGAGANGNYLHAILIADNVSTGGFYPAIRLAAGSIGAAYNRIEHATIVGNDIQMPRTDPNGYPYYAISLQTGDSPDTSTSPATFADHNYMNDVAVLANTIAGPAGPGINVSAGFSGAASNQITGLDFEANRISTVIDRGDPAGIAIGSAGGNDSLLRSNTGNQVDHVRVAYNDITLRSVVTGSFVPFSTLSMAGVLLYAARDQASQNTLNTVTVASNNIDSDAAGITVLGGLGRLGSPPDQNTVSGVTLSCNSIPHAPSVPYDVAGVLGINLIGGLHPATHNVVAGVTLTNNDVAGSPDSSSRFANLDTATANTVGPAPTVISITPGQGSTLGSTSVVITGTNFLAGAATCAANQVAVRFGPNPARITGCTDDQHLTVASPGQGSAAALVDVAVVTAGGSSASSPADGFTYQPIDTHATTSVQSASYHLDTPNDGSFGSWVEIDSSLRVNQAPSVDGTAVVSANIDLWTAQAGYNQDVGVFVSTNSGPDMLIAWKESGGFAGTFSPNAAFVQTVLPVTAGSTYLFKMKWKPNKPAPGQTLYGAAGTSTTQFSPSRLTVRLVPTSVVYTAVQKNSYHLDTANDGGFGSWVAVDPVLDVIVPGADTSVQVSANMDLWTANAGYNQDLGLFASIDGGGDTLIAWKESGGFAGTFSPNAAFVTTVYPTHSGHSYTFKLKWKPNKSAPGNTLYGAGGTSTTEFSPTRVTVEQLMPGTFASAVQNASFHIDSPNSGAFNSWQELSPTDRASITPTVTGQAVVTGNMDLWTSTATFNQDLAIFSCDGSLVDCSQFANYGMIAWKESGGFAGTYSPNAATVQSSLLLASGHPYTFALAWKANHSAPGGAIYGGAGTATTQFSPTTLILQLGS